MAKPAPKPKTIVIDPLTRVEGHLRIEAQLDATNKVTSALSSGTMVRGVEIILKGRDPRDAWAFTQRNCGVCTWVHALASTRAVENALGISIPVNAQLIRNLTTASWNVPDHWMHFYQLHALDFVYLPSALNASVADTVALQNIVNPNFFTGYLQKYQPGVPDLTTYFTNAKNKLAAFVASGQLGIFRQWNHPTYKLPPAANLLAFAHYLECLAAQREVIRIHAILGGKNPHPMTLVGGVPCAISVGQTGGHMEDFAGGRTALNQAGFDLIQQKITQEIDFCDQVHIPDTLAVAAFYPEYTTVGEGLGNFMSLGEFPHTQFDNPPTGFRFPPGIILNRDLSNVLPMDDSQIFEYVAHSWYSYSTGKNSALHPSVGQTNLNFTGTVPFTNLNPSADYSWIKSPRCRVNGTDRAMEVGPLSRILIDYALGTHQPTIDLVNYTLATLADLIRFFGTASIPPGPLPPSVLFSTLGRTAARALNAHILAHEMQVWYDQLVANVQAGDFDTFNEVGFNPANWPANAKTSVGVSGFGTCEAPRGSLAHWVTIKNSVIDNYQVVAPTTWNGSPRDAAGNPGAFEAALPNHVLANATQPLEILRTIHSFDPCLACAIHVVDPNGEDLVEVKVK